MSLALYCLVRKMPFVQFTPNLLFPVFMCPPPPNDPSLRCIALPHGFRWCWCWCHRPPPSIPVTAAPPFSPISVPRADLRTDRAAGPPAHPAPTLVVYPSGPLPPPSHRRVSHLSLVIDAPPLRFDAPSHPAPLPRGWGLSHTAPLPLLHLLPADSPCMDAPRKGML